MSYNNEQLVMISGARLMGLFPRVLASVCNIALGTRRMGWSAQYGSRGFERKHSERQAYMFQAAV
jgi:hypothetical protein